MGSCFGGKGGRIFVLVQDEEDAAAAAAAAAARQLIVGKGVSFCVYGIFVSALPLSDSGEVSRSKCPMIRAVKKV